ncbi:MAG: CsbD family protein [Methylococcales bacterium]|nr:CsbD family protein [Methylococcaceae bacterium]
MSWDQVQGDWQQVKAKVKETWRELSDDELDQIAGNRNRLLGKIQEKYGIELDQAEKCIQDFEMAFR